MGTHILCLFSAESKGCPNVQLSRSVFPKPVVAGVNHTVPSIVVSGGDVVAYPDHAVPLINVRDGPVEVEGVTRVVDTVAKVIIPAPR